MTNKLKNLSKNELKAITEYEKLLLENFPRRLRKIVLFGSKARGDSKGSSDIDLLVVLSKNGKNIKRKAICLIHEPIAKYLVDLSPIVVEEKFLQRWSPLLEHIMKDGITLWTNRRAKKNM